MDLITAFQFATLKFVETLQQSGVHLHMQSMQSMRGSNRTWNTTALTTAAPMVPPTVPTVTVAFEVSEASEASEVSEVSEAGTTAAATAAATTAAPRDDASDAVAEDDETKKKALKSRFVPDASGFATSTSFLAERACVIYRESQRSLLRDLGDLAAETIEADDDDEQ